MQEPRYGHKSVWVFGEVRGGRIHPVTLELAGKARELADDLKGQVSVLLAGGPLEEDPRLPLSHGADRVLLVEHPSLREPNPEVAAKVLAALVTEEKPEIVLAPATAQGRSVLPAAAAWLRTGLTADCTGLAIDPDSGLLLQTRPAIGGNVMATIKTPEHRPQMATVRPRTFRIPASDPRPGEVVRPVLPESVFACRVENLGMELFEPGEGQIQDKEVLVSGGKGLKRPEGFALIRELADLLEGGVGASRPTVEARWIPYAHQVGLSGQVVSPKLYVAAGISGAVQHLAGMQTSQKIVAVNKDPEAPIFRVADVALCGDLNDILPRLIARIRQERRPHHG